MNPGLATVVGAVLIILGVGLFPFAIMALLAALAGTAPLWVVVALDALLLIMGATAVVGLWSTDHPAS